MVVNAIVFKIWSVFPLHATEASSFICIQCLYLNKNGKIGDVRAALPVVDNFEPVGLEV